MKLLITLFRGLGLPPALVGAFRGILLAAIIAAIQAIIMGVRAIDIPPQSAWIAPILFFGLRQLEALADHIDPAKRSKP